LLIVGHGPRIPALAFRQAGYVWLIGNNGNTGARIAWTPALHAYFVSHFRLIGLPTSFLGGGDVPPRRALHQERLTCRCDMSVT